MGPSASGISEKQARNISSAKANATKRAMRDLALLTEQNGCRLNHKTARGEVGGSAEFAPVGPSVDSSGRSAEGARAAGRGAGRHGVSKVNLILGGHSGREGNHTAQCGTLLPCTASPRQKQTERRLTLLLMSGPFTGACI